MFVRNGNYIKHVIKSVRRIAFLKSSFKNITRCNSNRLIHMEKSKNQEYKKGGITSGENVSFWVDSTERLSYHIPDRDVVTDVLIIGGGIAGLTTAFKLLQAGKSVVLVEDGCIGSGETGRTTAHLASALDDRYYFLEETFGEDNTKLIAESHEAAINEIETIIATLNIECSFKRVNGYLFLHDTDKEENLQKELEATQRAGLSTYMLDETPLLAHGENQKTLVFSNQAQFHIMKYLKGLANGIISLGGTIYTQAHAEDISKKGAKVNGYMFSAKHVVVATNSPVNDTLTMHTKQHAYRTYVIAGKLPKGRLPYCLWWDTGAIPLCAVGKF
jgi:glycine/D-amino acid oxidase-like deaminating enzyme